MSGIVLAVLFALVVFGVINYLCYCLSQRAGKEIQKKKSALELEDTEKGVNVEVEGRKCVVCLNTMDKSVLYIPCRHAVVCVDCDKDMDKKDPCPVCRQDIIERMDIFA